VVRVAFAIDTHDRDVMAWVATVGETVDFATALNLVPRFTPVRSPESNGVCEAFVKTFKRDYIRVNPRPDAISVLQQLPAWFDDYNAVHPQSGLRMLSPREFIAQQSSTPAACPGDHAPVGGADCPLARRRCGRRTPRLCMSRSCRYIIADITASLHASCCPRSGT
jgi:hypothetical protein